MADVDDFGLGLGHLQQQPPRLDSLAHNASWSDKEARRFLKDYAARRFRRQEKEDLGVMAFICLAVRLRGGFLFQLACVHLDV